MASGHVSFIFVTYCVNLFEGRSGRRVEKERVVVGDDIDDDDDALPGPPQASVRVIMLCRTIGQSHFFLSWFSILQRPPQWIDDKLGRTLASLRLIAKESTGYRLLVSYNSVTRNNNGDDPSHENEVVP